MSDQYDWDDEEETADGVDDDPGLDEHPTDDELAASAAADDAELSEAEEELARHEASLQADALLHEYKEGGDQPIPYTGDAESMRTWGEWLEKSLVQSAAERAEIDAVFEAEQAGQYQDERAPIDFGRWDGPSFTDLLDRVTGKKAADAPRRGIDDDEFSGALALLNSEE